jgi:hypothetical protein
MHFPSDFFFFLKRTVISFAKKTVIYKISNIVTVQVTYKMTEHVCLQVIDCLRNRWIYTVKLLHHSLRHCCLLEKKEKSERMMSKFKSDEKNIKWAIYMDRFISFWYGAGFTPYLVKTCLHWHTKQILIWSHCSVQRFSLSNSVQKCSFRK